MQFATLRVWQVLLAGLGSPLRTPVAGRILFIGQLGKYIPGSVWPVLAQMELGARAKVPRPRSASASILTMLLSLLTGLLVAAVTLPFAQGDEHYLWVFAVVPVVDGLPAPQGAQPAAQQDVQGDQAAAARPAAPAGCWRTPSPGRSPRGLFNGLQIWILAEKFGAPDRQDHPAGPWRVRVAWCAGFVFVIAPAGAGVRDPLLTASLTPVIGYGPALAVMLVSRAVNTISDLLVAGIAAATPPPRGHDTEGKDQPRSPLRPPPRSARGQTAARTARRSAAEDLVPGLGGFLLRLPPPLVAAVPVDGRG